jgi:hypothetical protein
VKAAWGWYRSIDRIAVEAIAVVAQISLELAYRNKSTAGTFVGLPTIV